MGKEGVFLFCLKLTNIGISKMHWRKMRQSMPGPLTLEEHTLRIIRSRQTYLIISRGLQNMIQVETRSSTGPDILHSFSRKLQDSLKVTWQNIECSLRSSNWKQLNFSSPDLFNSYQEEAWNNVIQLHFFLNFVKHFCHYCDYVKFLTKTKSVEEYGIKYWVQ